MRRQDRLTGIVKSKRGIANLSACSPCKLRFGQASENLLVHSPCGMANVIEGLITGIGFIGGGLFSKRARHRDGEPVGHGAIGVSVGLGAASTWRLKIIAVKTQSCPRR
jgi:hypothetical protein